MNDRNDLGIAVALCATLATYCEGQTVGTRPYEMVWANRLHDTRPPLLDFESVAGWTVSTEQAVAIVGRCRKSSCCGASTSPSSSIAAAARSPG